VVTELPLIHLGVLQLQLVKMLAALFGMQAVAVALMKATQLSAWVVMVAADKAQLHQAQRLLEQLIQAVVAVVLQGLTVKRAAQELSS
jgi:hypothetical protein